MVEVRKAGEERDRVRGTRAWGDSWLGDRSGARGSGGDSWQVGEAARRRDQVGGLAIGQIGCGGRGDCSITGWVDHLLRLASWISRRGQGS